MQRRALLASGGALLGSVLAGCLGGFDAPESTETPTDDTQTTEYYGTTDDTPETTQFDVELDVELERHQPNVAVMGIDSVGVRPDGYQYLFYRVDVTDGDPPERTDFGFRYGGQVYSPDVDTGGTLRNQEASDQYTAERGEGWLVFELPAERPAEQAAFALGSEEWPVDDATRERLSSRAPDLELDWDAPAEQPAGESRFRFTVINDSDRDTWFVGGLNAIEIRAAHSAVAGIQRKIPGGETVSWEITHDNGKEPDDDAVGDGETDGTYHLKWHQGEQEVDVYFVAPEE